MLVFLLSSTGICSLGHNSDNYVSSFLIYRISVPTKQLFYCIFLNILLCLVTSSLPAQNACFPPSGILCIGAGSTASQSSLCL